MQTGDEPYTRIGYNAYEMRRMPCKSGLISVRLQRLNSKTMEVSDNKTRPV